MARQRRRGTRIAPADTHTVIHLLEQGRRELRAAQRDLTKWKNEAERWRSEARDSAVRITRIQAQRDEALGMLEHADDQVTRLAQEMEEAEAATQCAENIAADAWRAASDLKAELAIVRTMSVLAPGSLYSRRQRMAELEAREARAVRLIKAYIANVTGTFHQFSPLCVEMEEWIAGYKPCDLAKVNAPSASKTLGRII